MTVYLTTSGQAIALQGCYAAQFGTWSPTTNLRRKTSQKSHGRNYIAGGSLKSRDFRAVGICIGGITDKNRRVKLAFLIKHCTMKTHETPEVQLLRLVLRRLIDRNLSHQARKSIILFRYLYKVKE